MYRVYGISTSGNCYKVKLLLTQLGENFEWVEVERGEGGTRSKEFLAINPNGKVPVLEIEPGRYLPESNAILCYLADGTDYWPVERYHRAQTLQWLFFEQATHAPNVAIARFICKFFTADHPRRAELPELHKRGYEALNVMEKCLEKNSFLVGGRYSIADIALYAYTHTAESGGFSFADYPAIRAWLGRVAETPGYLPM